MNLKISYTTWVECWDTDQTLKMSSGEFLYFWNLYPIFPKYITFRDHEGVYLDQLIMNCLKFIWLNRCKYRAVTSTHKTDKWSSHLTWYWHTVDSRYSIITALSLSRTSPPFLSSLSLTNLEQNGDVKGKFLKISFKLKFLKNIYFIFSFIQSRKLAIFVWTV